MRPGWENNLPNAIKGFLKLKGLGEQDIPFWGILWGLEVGCEQGIEEVENWNSLAEGKGKR